MEGLPNVPRDPLLEHKSECLQPGGAAKLAAGPNTPPPPPQQPVNHLPRQSVHFLVLLQRGTLPRVHVRAADRAGAA